MLLVNLGALDAGQLPLRTRCVHQSAYEEDSCGALAVFGGWMAIGSTTPMTGAGASSLHGDSVRCSGGASMPGPSPLSSDFIDLCIRWQDWTRPGPVNEVRSFARLVAVPAHLAPYLFPGPFALARRLRGFSGYDKVGFALGLVSLTR